MDDASDGVLAAYAAGIRENLDRSRSLANRNEGDASIGELFEPGTGSPRCPEHGGTLHAFSLSTLCLEGDNADEPTHVIHFVYREP